jgi:tetratricopeptide (TPR) repeat protein
MQHDYQLNDFKNKEAWLIFRLDVFVQSQPLDIYTVMELPSGQLLAMEIVETELASTGAALLLKTAKKKAGYSPQKILLSSPDPAETLLNQCAKTLHMHFECVAERYLYTLLAPVKKSFAERTFSPSSMGYADSETQDAEDLESIRQMVPDSYALCPCASGSKYKFCCKRIFCEITEAMVAAEEGRIYEALEWIDKAKKMVGETAEVLCREAIVYSYSDLTKAREVLRRCFSMNPKHPRANYINGWMFKQQGDFANALKSYETAIENYPKTDHFHLNEAYNNLGTVFHAMGDLANAKIAWEKALLYSPKDKMTQKNLSVFIYQTGEKNFVIQDGDG